jgi:pyridinium-3,5-biscarboxylic acid mononucleotide synthase
MNESALKKLLEEVRRGKLPPDDALARLRHMPFEDLGFAKVDHHRALRAGFPEVILGAGKSPQQVAEIFARLARHKNNVLVTRATRAHFIAVRKKSRRAEYCELARAIVLKQD